MSGHTHPPEHEAIADAVGMLVENAIIVADWLGTTPAELARQVFDRLGVAAAIDGRPAPTLHLPPLSSGFLARYRAHQAGD